MTKFKAQKRLDYAVIKQAIRDCSSKNELLVSDSLEWFNSDEFKIICERNNILPDKVIGSVREMLEYPIITRKKFAIEIAKLLNDSIT
jgi:hypothetical protein|tara:strand:- start:587 stop:850 length:264 start_codon:yes stop_codon:yes gene_type:complete